MKNKLIVSMCLGSLIAFTAPVTFAGDMKSQPGQMMKVLKDLQSKGYVIVKKIEFDNDNGDFKADVVNGQGKDLEIKVNPKTGKMVKPKEDVTGWTAIEIAKKVSDAGHKNIYEINTEMMRNQYDVKVLNEKGEKVSIKVDAKTGSITKISD